MEYQEYFTRLIQQDVVSSKNYLKYVISQKEKKKKSWYSVPGHSLLINKYQKKNNTKIAIFYV